MRRRTVLTGAVVMVAAPILAACNPEAAPTQPAEDVPDCDLGDLIEGDPDCYGKPAATRSPTARPKQTSGAAKPAGKSTPKPGRTRR